MFSFLSGRLMEHGERYVVLDCGGIGYKIRTSERTIHNLPANQDVCRLYVFLNRTKTELFLVGFLKCEELECYKLLTGVNGAGCKAALEILSTLTPDEVYFSVLAGETEVFSKVKGVGKKLANRIVLELKDKVPDSVNNPIESTDGGDDDLRGILNMAKEGLVSLGYRKEEAIKALQGIDLNQPVENVISQALKNLY